MKRLISPRSLLFALMVVLLPGLAWSSAAQRAQDLVDEAEYEQASRVLRQALAAKNLKRRELVELYRLQGTVMVALGKRGRAESAFRNLILSDPGFALSPGTSPKVRKVFDQVQAQLQQSGALDKAFQPELTPIGLVTPGQDVTLHLVLGDAQRARQIRRVLVYYRRVGSPHYSSVDARSSAIGEWTGVIPGFFLDAEREDYAMHYYVEAVGEGDRRLTGVGSPTLPLSFDVLGSEPLDGDAAGEREGGLPWVTLAVVAGGVVVVGALVGVGAYFLLGQQATGSAEIKVVKAP